MAFKKGLPMRGLLSTAILLITIMTGCGGSGDGDETVSPTVSTMRIACVGDSITEGYGLSSPATQSYPAQLAGMLPSAAVGNFGKAGATLLEAGDRPYVQTAQFEASKAFAPTVVVIALGTNDAKDRNWVHRNGFIQDYLDLIATYRNLASKPTVYIALPPPVFRSTQGISNRRIRDEIHPLIRQVAAQSGVGLIDLYTPLQGKARLFPDGIHPDPEGAAIIAETVYHAVNGS